MKFKFDSGKLVHIGFDIGLLFKAVNATAEILGGFLFIFFPPQKLNAFITFVTRGFLTKHPHNPLMNALVQLGNSFGISSWHFVIFYLLSHGLVKFVIVVLLWKKKLWAYPFTVVVLVGFIVYQIARFVGHHSIPMLLLTIMDILMIVLTVLEYQRIKKERKKSE